MTPDSRSRAATQVGDDAIAATGIPDEFGVDQFAPLLLAQLSPLAVEPQGVVASFVRRQAQPDDHRVVSDAEFTADLHAGSAVDRLPSGVDLDGHEHAVETDRLFQGRVLFIGEPGKNIVGPGVGVRDAFGSDYEFG